MSGKIQNRFRSLFVETIVLVILASVSIFLFTRLSVNQQEKTAAPSTTPSSSPVVESVQTEKPSTYPTAVPSQQPINSTIKLNIISPEKTYSYNIPAKGQMTAMEVTELGKNYGMTLKTKDFGAPLGVLVEAINEIANDSKEQKYWTLYINDKMSVTGASSTVVNIGESVSWKFENTTL